MALTALKPSVLLLLPPEFSDYKYAPPISLCHLFDVFKIKEDFSSCVNIPRHTLRLAEEFLSRNS